MSSDEKALKKDFEKGNIKLYASIDYPGSWRVSTKGFMDEILFETKDLKDLNSLLSELLDTHTVKEECEHKKYTLSVSTRNGTRKICNNCGKDYQKEEPTTPEEEEDGVIVESKNIDKVTLGGYPICSNCGFTESSHKILAKRRVSTWSGDSPCKEFVQPATPEKNPACGVTDQALGKEPQYKIACNDCGSGKQLFYEVNSKYGKDFFLLYDGITKETRSHEKKCPSCGSLNVEATKI